MRQASKFREQWLDVSRAELEAFPRDYPRQLETRRLQWLADSTADSHSGTLGPVFVTGERTLPLDDEIAAAGAFRRELLLELLCLARGDGIEAA